MDLNAIEAESFRRCSSLSVGLNYLIDVLLGHRFGDLFARRRKPGWAHAVGRECFISLQHQPYMPELRHDPSARLMNLPEDLAPSRERFFAMEVGHVCIEACPRVWNVGSFGHDESHASFRATPVVRGHLKSWNTPRRLGPRHGRHHDSIIQRQAVNPKGLKKSAGNRSMTHVRLGAAKEFSVAGNCIFCIIALAQGNHGHSVAVIYAFMFHFLSRTILGRVLLLTSVFGAALFGQDSATSSESGSLTSVAEARPQPGATSTPIDRRAYGILPNYRTANYSDAYVPLSAARKFHIATKDSFDYPIFFLGGVFAGLGQLDNAHGDFGQGAQGFAKRYVTSFADQAIGNYMTEGFMPALLHEDPRYFRVGPEYGGKKKRMLYAATRVFVTRTDKGNWRFNYSELLGNSVASGIANAYYPQERTLGDNVGRVATQFGTDALSQVLKEFWPDIKQKFFKHRSQSSD